MKHIRLAKDTYTTSHIGYPGYAPDEFYDGRTAGIFIRTWCLIGVNYHKDQPSGHWWFTIILFNTGIIGAWHETGLDAERERNGYL